jgi:hypothetical protein
MSKLTPTETPFSDQITFVSESLRAVKEKNLANFQKLLYMSQNSHIINWFRTAFLLYIAETQYPEAFQQVIGEELFSFSQQETSRRLLVMRHYPVEFTPLLNPQYANVPPSYYEAARSYGLDTLPYTVSLSLIDTAIEQRLSRDEFRALCRQHATTLNLSNLPQRKAPLKLDPLLTDSQIAEAIHAEYGIDRAQRIANALIITVEAINTTTL